MVWVGAEVDWGGWEGYPVGGVGGGLVIEAMFGPSTNCLTQQHNSSILGRLQKLQNSSSEKDNPPASVHVTVDCCEELSAYLDWLVERRARLKERCARAEGVSTQRDRAVSTSRPVENKA